MSQEIIKTTRNYGILIYPLRSTGEFQNIPTEIYHKNGLEISIERFTSEIKKKLLGVTVTKLKNSFSWQPFKRGAIVDSIQAEYIIRFKCCPNEGFLSEFKLFEFKNLVTKLSLLQLGVGPQLIHHDYEKVSGGFGSSNYHHKYLNRPFAKLNEDSLDMFRQLCYECFNNFHKRKKAMTLLSLFEMTQIYGTLKGLRCSLYVTILESLFAPDSPELKYKFSMRLTKYLQGDETTLKYFNDMYKYRSKFYHQGDDKFSHDDEMKLQSITSKLLKVFILNKEKINVKSIDSELIKN